MSCTDCGAPSQGDRCQTCRQIRHNEEYYGVPADHHDREEWRVQQTGLGDRGVNGQATIDGGIVREGGDEE